MALYFFRHQHTEETCPTKNRPMMLQLLQHTSQAGADPFGVTIHGEAVIQNEHTLVMILEADSEEAVRQYAQPFSMIGSVEIKPAATCEQVVDTGCGSAGASALAAQSGRASR